LTQRRRCVNCHALAYHQPPYRPVRARSRVLQWGRRGACCGASGLRLVVTFFRALVAFSPPRQRQRRRTDLSSGRGLRLRGFWSLVWRGGRDPGCVPCASHCRGVEGTCRAGYCGGSEAATREAHEQVEDRLCLTLTRETERGCSDQAAWVERIRARCAFIRDGRPASLRRRGVPCGVEGCPAAHAARIRRIGADGCVRRTTHRVSF